MMHYTPATLLQLWFPHFNITQNARTNSVSIDFPISPEFYADHGLVIKGVIEEIPYVKSMRCKIEKLQAQVDELEEFKDKCKEVMQFLAKE